jgi:hypothetical protein
MSKTPVEMMDEVLAESVSNDEWSAEFECAPGREQELTRLIGDGVFQGGLDALKRNFR